MSTKAKQDGDPATPGNYHTCFVHGMKVGWLLYFVSDGPGLDLGVDEVKGT